MASFFRRGAGTAAARGLVRYHWSLPSYSHRNMKRDFGHAAKSATKYATKSHGLPFIPHKNQIRKASSYFRHPKSFISHERKQLRPKRLANKFYKKTKEKAESQAKSMLKNRAIKGLNSAIEYLGEKAGEEELAAELAAITEEIVIAAAAAL